MLTASQRLLCITTFAFALSCQAEDLSTEASAAIAESPVVETTSEPIDEPAAAEQVTDEATTSSPPAQPAATDQADGSQPGFWERQWNKVVDTYHSPNSELIVPLYTWHNRAMYDRHKIDEYNENPWGLGYGRVRYDEDGDQHTVYAMVFMDSHNDPEPFVGYAFEKIWRPSKNWRLGAGFTAGITMRSDYSYVPIPAILPIVSLGYRRLTLEATYIPGGHNNGNILFTWARWAL